MSDQHKPKVLGPNDGDAGFLTAMVYVLWYLAKSLEVALPSLSTRCRLMLSGLPCIAIPTRMSTVLYSRDKLEHYLAMKWCMGMLATLSLNPVGSGIHSGTLAISPPESLKSFRHQGLSSISERWWHCHRMQHLLIVRQ
jgi:hypothetical protein